jgi:hypothetical protein
MIVVISVTLCTIPVTSSKAASFNTPSTTSWPAWCPGSPNSLYDNPTQSSSVTQLFNGSIKGCFRVPNDRSQTLHVAWQSFVRLNATSFGPTTTNGVSNSGSDGNFKLTVSATHVYPGQHVTVIGRYLTGHRPPNTEGGILCWDGCQSGLQEQGQNLVWVSSTEFRTTLVVPNAPWFVSHDGRASVHPLSSGTYPVGIECVTVASGCANEAADAQVNVDLVAPKATWCTTTLPCGSLHVNSVHTSVGDVVEVHGKAPLVMIIARPFGYWLAYSSKGLGNGTVSFHSPVTSETTASIAPRTLLVKTGATWARQNFTPVVASSWSTMSRTTPSSNGATFATCDASAIVITGGERTIRVPTTSAGAVLVAHHLTLNGSKAAGTCASALVDPNSPSRVFATFYSAEDGVIPPSYLAGLYSINAGTTWNLVPTPTGHTRYDFGGFLDAGSRIEALFINKNNDGANYTPRTMIAIESTSNGGDSWVQSTLGCPSIGPCIVFEPSILGNCAMNAQPEAVLFGVAPESAGGAIFRESRWITAVNACFSQELAVTQSGTELLLDPSSQFPLVASRDDGRTWYNVQLPPLAGLGTDVSAGWPSLIADTAGALFATTSGDTGGTTLYKLAPHSTSWCRVRVLSKGSSTYVSPVRTAGDDLFWGEGSSEHLTVHLVPTASLRCQ